ncbi:MAG: hypothetical protein IKG46_12455 [Solobacterium sp.]|nr:hypothetical protein [Solobacterium sp.]
MNNKTAEQMNEELKKELWEIYRRRLALDAFLAQPFDLQNDNEDYRMNLRDTLRELYRGLKNACDPEEYKKWKEKFFDYYAMHCDAKEWTTYRYEIAENPCSMTVPTELCRSAENNFDVLKIDWEASTATEDEVRAVLTAE